MYILCVFVVIIILLQRDNQLLSERVGDDTGDKPPPIPEVSIM